MPLTYPGATFRPIEYRSEAGSFIRPPLGWVLHVVVGNGSPHDTFANAVSPNRRFSHFWVSKSGQVEQFQTVDMKSWAQGAGNGEYWSVETEGFPSEALTDAQLDALARLHVFLGAPDRVANAVGEGGIGTHYMGGQAWGGHSCPDPAGLEGRGLRSGQRSEVLTRAARLRQGHSEPRPFPLPSGWYFGPQNGPERSVSGYHGHSADLATWQHRMHDLGHGLAVDGHYGPQTEAVAKAFQASKALGVDGLIGRATWDASWRE